MQRSDVPVLVPVREASPFMPGRMYIGVMDTSASRTISTRDLIQAGLHNLDTARELIARATEHLPDELVTVLLDALKGTGDPDTALRSLVDIHEHCHNTADNGLGCFQHEDALSKLIKVLGNSEYFGTLMRTRPDLVQAACGDQYHGTAMDADQRRNNIWDAVQGVGETPSPVVRLARQSDALRASYRRQLVSIMVEDLCADDAMEIQPQVSRALSDLVDAALTAALRIAQEHVPNGDKCRFTIIGMGKLGAREINYISDVDVMYVVEPVKQAEVQDDHEALQGMALTRVGTKIGALVQRLCQSVIPGGSEPALWQIDNALRPEGKDGPLVRTLESYRGYYEQWAENWEFQALLKARPCAGDEALGQAFSDMVRPMVWSASARKNFVYDCQQMRKRVESLIPEALKNREMKLGKGGLRDVEFTVQMLQLVHGRSDETLRIPSTLGGLQALSKGGYVSRKQAEHLSWDYRFERVLEHRQQMWAMKRTHLFPDLGGNNQGGLDRKRELSPEDVQGYAELRRLARQVGMRSDELVERFDETRREIRHLHTDIYYRPMLPISAQAGADPFTLSQQAARERFESIGFADAQAAMQHVEALTEGVSRAARINRIILPAVLQWLGQGQNPDMGLLRWRTLEERFRDESEYLGFLRDSPSAAGRLCHVLSNSRFLGEALNKSVESVTWLGDDDALRPRSRASLDVQCKATLERSSASAKDFATSMRALRRHEIERIGLGWMNHVIQDDDALDGMSDVNDAIIDASVSWAMRHRCEEWKVNAAPATIAIIGMGRYGGREMNFSSDADAMIIYQARNGVADEQANAFAKQVVDDVRSILQGPVSLEARIDLDLDLRPEGKNGPLVRSLSSCAEYYASWASTWEHQALLRARHCAGDEALSQQFLAEIANPLRYPAEALDETQIGEIRKLKARMESERLPRGVRRERHLKLGKGGLSDVEWSVQLMQMQHACKHETLRTQSTMVALQALTDLGLVSKQDSFILRKAWKLCTAARNGNYLWSGRASRADILPDDLYSLGGIAIYMGYDAHQGQHFENDMLAVMRQCREVTERLFYGL